MLSGGVQKMKDWSHEQALQLSASKGFVVENILVEGRRNTDADVIMAMLNIQKGDPLLGFEPAAAQDLIEKISWVKSAQVQRRFPDTVYVALEERAPVALWQSKGKLRLIDKEGFVLTDKNLNRFSDLIIVTGEEAPENVQVILEALTYEPGIFKVTESASFISKRRWDLVLKNKIKVQLPEEDMEFALTRLAQAQQESGILDKAITSIDLRDPARMIVQTPRGMAQDYEATLTPAAGAPI